jgi:hypothetical protein
LPHHEGRRVRVVSTEVDVFLDAPTAKQVDFYRVAINHTPTKQHEY